MNNARQERPEDGHEREAFPRQHGPKLELVRDPEDVAYREGHDQVLRPAEHEGQPRVREASDRELPPRGRQELQRVRVRHGPGDEDGGHADAEEEAQERAAGGEQGDFRDGGAEGRDEDGEEAEEYPGVGHVELVELGHVAEDAVDVGVACQTGLVREVGAEGRCAGVCGDVCEFGAEEGEELGESGGAFHVRLDGRDGGEEGDDSKE